MMPEDKVLTPAETEAIRAEGWLNYRMREFVKRYEPEDRRYRLDFERDLHEIVRTIYQEAQRPLLKAITDATLRMPSPLFVEKKQEAK